MIKVILHLCADTGSDSYPYSQDPNYEVVLIGSKIGVENFSVNEWIKANGQNKIIYGVFANPVCTEFSTARKGGRARDPLRGVGMVRECMRVIDEAEKLGNLQFWVIENPAKGRLKDFMKPATYQYEPWWYGSPWTKKTALWGKFNIPARLYTNWDDVPRIDGLYTRPGRPKPSLAFMHKNHKRFIREFDVFDDVGSDMEFRSLCSQKFAQAFKQVNK
jgi:hypothetical protein